jgi:leader peptidase (prepilin peptidase)/N-methyltransferase
VTLNIINAVFCGFLGAALGSFLACAASRIPLKMSLVQPRSFCDSCGTQLKDSWNIPLFSWPFLRGRAACCGEKIPFRFWLSEIFWFFAGAAAGYFLFTPLAFAGLIIMIALIVSGIAEVIHRKAKT